MSASDRLVRQIQKTDAWIEVLRRTHDTIKGRCARGLVDSVALMRPPGVTAVIAHRHAWFVDRLARLHAGNTLLAAQAT